MLVGITCDSETVTDRRGFLAPRFVSPEPYARAVAAAGALPVLLPHVEIGFAELLLDSFAAVVITGGDFDVPPSYYGERPRSGLGRIAFERSAFERALCQGALRRNLPLLAVCGGMQLLNVVRGGSLFQDLSERPGTDQHVQPHDRRQPHHSVSVTAGSLLARACGGASVLWVNSTHHQVLRELGQSVQASAVAADGVVEAIEVTDCHFALGVQWHPELLETSEQRIYEALVEATRG